MSKCEFGLCAFENTGACQVVNTCKECDYGKLVMKEIPKKPLIERWNPALCPSCNAYLSESIGDGYYKHWDSLDRCPECNQKLTWD